MSFQIIICQKINYVESFNLKAVISFFFSFFKYILGFLTRLHTVRGWQQVTALGTDCSWQGDKSTSTKPPGNQPRLPVSFEHHSC